MSKVHKSVIINAPVGKVFSFVTAPENWTRYVTSLVAVTDQSPDLPAKGGTFKWQYKMMGVKMSGKGEVSESVKNKVFGLRLTGKASINEHYEFESNPDGTTTLKVGIDYEMPGEMMQAIANSKLVEKLNAMESKNVLDKIKAMCEA